MMRAAVYHGPGDLRVEERPRPTVSPNEALLKVAACGVCGTDHRIVSGSHGSFPPGTIRVPGHEIVGEIVEAGAEVRDALPKGPVFVAPNMGCGRCSLCLSGSNNRCPEFQAIGITLDGAFAEYVRIPGAAIAQGNVIALRPGLDFAEATLIEPLACVLRGQSPLDIQPAETVLVIGAGPIGVLHVMLAHLKGAGRVLIADRLANRLQFACRQGADLAIDVSAQSLKETVMAETVERGADVVIVAAPAHEVSALALELCAYGGRVSWFAGLPRDRSRIEIDANLVHYRELRITGTTACSTLDCYRAAEIMSSGRLDLAPLLTRRLALQDSVSEFGGVKNRGSIKTVLIP
jgi:L-iditol 2-dehydrogenase